MNMRRRLVDVVRSIPRHLEKLAASAVAAVVGFTLPPVIGLIASTNAPAIKSSFPFVWPHGSGAFRISPEAELICALVGVSALIFIARESALKREAARAHQRLEKQEAERHAELRTLPSGASLRKFSESYDALTTTLRSNQVALVAAERRGDPREVNSSIVDCVSALTVLAASLSVGRSRRLCGEVMLIFDKNDVTVDDGSLKGDIFFHEGPVDPLDGVLQSVPDLCSVIVEPDMTSRRGSAARIIAYPIPHERRSSWAPHRTKYLPGPAAALIDGFHVIADTRRLAVGWEQTDAYQDLPRSVFERMHRYYTQTPDGGLIRSVTSVAVASVLDPRNSNHEPGRPVNPLGVVNIYSDKEEMFAVEWVKEAFYCYAKPIIMELCPLIESRSRCLANARANIGNPVGGAILSGLSPAGPIRNAPG